MLPVDTRLLADPEAVAIAACHLISAAAAAAIAQRQIFRLVLAGGTTPGRIYQWLADNNAAMGSLGNFLG
jgi:6-phosphogluconolactonase